MTIDELNNYLCGLPEQIKRTVPNVVAETATKYSFKTQYRVAHCTIPLAQ